MVAQLEHQFRLGKLSIQGLWFYCQVCLCLNHYPFLLKSLTNVYFCEILQPMMGSMQALSVVIRKASADNIGGSALLNLLQSQV